MKLSSRGHFRGKLEFLRKLEENEENKEGIVVFLCGYASE